MNWERRTFWIPLLMGVALVLGLAANISLLTELGRPFGGYISQPAPQADTASIDPHTPAWWPGLNQSGLSYDDVLLRVNGRAYVSNEQAEFERSQSAVMLTVARDGRAIPRGIPVIRFSFAYLLDLELPILIDGLAFWLLAIVVYRARPAAAVNRLFAALCAASACATWLSITSIYAAPGLLMLIAIPFTVFVPSLVIHLALIFPRPLRMSRARPVIVLAYVLGAVITLADITAWLVWGQPGRAAWLGTLSRNGYMLLLALAILAMLLRLVWELLRQGREKTASRRERRGLLIVLGGIGVAMPYIVTLLGPLFNRQVTYPHYFNLLDLRYLLLSIPLALAYVILRYQAFQTVRPLFTAVFILAGSAILASLGTWLWQLSQPEILNQYTMPPFVILLAVALIASVFWAFQGHVRGTFWRLFHRRQHGYQAAMRFGNHVQGHVQSDLEHLSQVIIQTLTAELELEHAAIWLYRDDERQMELIASAGTWQNSPPDALALPRTEWTPGQRPCYLRRADVTLPPGISVLQNSPDIEVVAPLSTPDHMLGLLGMGKRWDEEIFDERDLEVVELIAQQSTLSLLTLMHMVELQQVPRRIAEAQERERMHLARELHDTVQQFLGRLPFYLEVSRGAVWDQPQQTDELLAACIADVERAARVVRQIRNNLVPSQLVNGFAEPAQELARRFEQRTGVTTAVSISPAIDRHLSLEGRHALYRVLQQALDNVEAHAAASLVEIDVVHRDGKIQFTVSDDGCGSSDHDRQRALEMGSFGLRSMHARVSGTGGQLTFISTPDQGTRILGWIPAEKTDPNEADPA